MAGKARQNALTKKQQALQRKILTDDEIRVFSRYMRESMGPGLAALLDEHSLSMEDTLRFRSLSARMVEARTEKGMTLKDLARSLKVPKYKVDYIERVSVKNIDPGILCRYVEALGLRTWFGRWKRLNSELAARMGLMPPQKPGKS
ncbi:MAG: hypothetical protein AB1499_17585 [Nitrospirota bacterium]